MSTPDEPFAHTRFLEAGASVREDAERLGMLAEHLEPGERALLFLPLKASSLLLTQRRLLELRPHLDVAGFWNVVAFRGYRVEREIPLRAVEDYGVQPTETGGLLTLKVAGETLTFALPFARDPGTASRTLEQLAGELRVALGSGG